MTSFTQQTVSRGSNPYGAASGISSIPQGLRSFSWKLTGLFLILIGLGSLQGVSAQNDCPIPQNIETPYVVSNSARIVWDAIPEIYSYEVSYRPVDVDYFMPAFRVYGPAVNLNHLVGCTEYEVRIRSYCGRGEFSEYATTRFTTTGCEQNCRVAPTNFGWTQADASSAQLFWNSVRGARSYEITWRTEGQSSFSNPVIVNGNRYRLGGLSACSEHEVRIRALCPNNIFSEFASVTFSTTGCETQCQDAPENLLSTNTEDTDADLAWDAVFGAQAYEVSYRRLEDDRYGPPMTVNTNRASLQELFVCSDYEVLVRARCDNNTYSPYSLTRFSTVGCATTCDVPPSNPVIDSTGSRWAKVSWTPAPGVLTYEVQYRFAGDTQWSAPRVVNCDCYDFTGLVPCARYEARVRAVCDVNRYSDYMTFEFQTGGCNGYCYNPAENIRFAEITLNSARVSWNGVNVSTQYEVSYRSDVNEPYSAPMTTPSTHLVLDNLTQCTRYDVRVRALCENRTYSDFSSGDFTTAGCNSDCNLPPADFAAANILPEAATVSWRSIQNAFYYEVSYRELGTQTWTAPMTTVETFAFVMGLESCTDYEFRVRGFCRENNRYSEYSTLTLRTAGCIPLCEEAPENLMVTRTTVSVANLKWDAVSGAQHYEVSIRPASDANFQGSIVVEDTTANFLNLLSCTDYVVRVRAFCGDNIYSDWTQVAFQSECCDKFCNDPYDLRVQSIDEQTAVVAWECCLVGLQTYEVSYRKLGEARFTSPMVTMHRTATLTNLLPDTDYQVRVRVNCGNGLFSNYDFELMTTRGGNVCSTPVVSAVIMNDNTAQLTWNPVHRARYYKIQYKPVSSNTWTQLPNQLGTTLTLSQLVPSMEYEVRICTVCPDGQSDFSNIRINTSDCSRPDDVIISEYTANSVRVSWSTDTERDACTVLAWGPATELDQNLNEVVIPPMIHSYVIDGLNGFDNVKVRLRTNCSTCSNVEGTFSNWTTFHNFAMAKPARHAETAGQTLNVYPNPTNGILTVEAPTSWNQLDEVTLEVVDLTGQVVKTIHLVTRHAQTTYELNMTDVPAGMYLLKSKEQSTLNYTRIIRR